MQAYVTLGLSWFTMCMLFDVAVATIATATCVHRDRFPGLRTMLWLSQPNRHCGQGRSFAGPAPIDAEQSPGFSSFGSGDDSFGVADNWVGDVSGEHSLSRRFAALCSPGSFRSSGTLPALPELGGDKSGGSVNWFGTPTKTLSRSSAATASGSVMTDSAMALAHVAAYRL